jgi:hypothetical protein
MTVLKADFESIVIDTRAFNPMIIPGRERNNKLGPQVASAGMAKRFILNLVLEISAMPLLGS